MSQPSLADRRVREPCREIPWRNQLRLNVEFRIERSRVFRRGLEVIGGSLRGSCRLTLIRRTIQRTEKTRRIGKTQGPSAPDLATQVSGTRRTLKTQLHDDYAHSIMDYSGETCRLAGSRLRQALEDTLKKYLLSPFPSASIGLLVSART